MGLQLSKKGQNAGHITPIPVQNHLFDILFKSFYLRNLVSKKRRRMIVGGYDLDMTYITDRILAMSFPAERVRSMYRNPLWQVKSVLDMRHHGHYKVYNLCTEQTYDPSHFHGRVQRFPFDDNHVPPLSMIYEFCKDVDSWLSSDPKNIVAIHCMAGKGRTGLMVSSYLVYCGLSAEKALQVYAEKRTTNNEGVSHFLRVNVWSTDCSQNIHRVSIPSQRRYVNYWEQVLSFPNGPQRGPPVVELPKRVTRELRRIRLYDTLNAESVFCVVSHLQHIPGQEHHQSTEVSKSWCRQMKKGIDRSDSFRYFFSLVDDDIQQEEEEEKVADIHEPHLVVQMDTERPILQNQTCLECYYDNPVQITGDVRIIFYEKLIGGRLFYACFNTAFISNSLLQLSLRDLDKIGTKGRSICGPSFSLELLFDPTNASGCLLLEDCDSS